jgi:hypothetical protein
MGRQERPHALLGYGFKFAAEFAEPGLGDQALAQPRATRPIRGSGCPPARQPGDDDPRLRLLGAFAMASIRITLDDWLVHRGSLPARVRAALSSARIE